ncbi:hypothetical protein FJV46_10725 [Arthrobacter agilis]|uniref:hypothetical protein n=1 Tax=Arthrobacter agilis TaxID=37921 RepID=UPI000B359590|nr:hypothetical protein [Arthrobacter agilis]OUM44150.1 hypothetical protein B8W74_04560 [Arthrobacter agilis]PPB46526.1 hypothetical protein CI784_06855 [Arthrobacter agilis]TPV23818.1 hypothetical protein FJV46_10725 [Arthrobacter agilis]VDR32553.1 Uncharacterised protein [Arthrobacter agilis]
MRYIATRLNGDGTETPLSFDVPLQGVRTTDDLSGPGGLEGSISPEVQRLQTAGGEPIFHAWSTALYAEVDGKLRGGAILAGLKAQGPSLSLDCVGFTGYLKDEPYTADYSRVAVDPLDVARHLWEHRQAKTNGNIGLTVDTTTSPIRIGTPVKETSFTTGAGEDVNFESGPYTLAWWKTRDLGKEFDDLATSTPFDYRVSHEWDGETIRHRLILGYPNLGARREDLRFVLGENLFQRPTIDLTGGDYASEVLVLGAGEGRKMVRSVQSTPTRRLHRTAVLEDKSLQSKAAADRAALLELRSRLGEVDITEVDVTNHPHARIGEYSPGDEILIQTRHDWAGEVSLWVRILSITLDPQTERSVLSVTRVERV